MITDSPINRHVKQLQSEMGFDDGWYFVDESENYNGPYVSEESAFTALREYIISLEHNAG